MTIANVIQRARRRLLWIEIASQGSYTICFALGAIVMLLLLGAQVLDWRWLAALPAAALATGAWRTVSRIPGPYATAQIVDRRLKLADSLSTAVFFSTPESTERGSVPACETQRSQAMRLSESVNPAEAIPFKAPRAIVPAGALALLCVSLFALRYGIEHRLDLRPSLAQILKHNFDAAELRAQELQKQDQKDRTEKRSGVKDAANSVLQDAASDPSRDTEKAKSAADSSQSAERADERQQAEAQREGDIQDRDGEQSSTDSLSPSERGRLQQNQRAGEAGEKEGLLSKMQDAMQNLFSSMKQHLGGAGRRQQSAANQSGESTNPQGRGRSMRSSQDKQGAGQESESQESQQATDAKGGQARGAGQGTDQQKGDQPGSASGNQEGSKDLKLAEQSAAEGQISRINGQRTETTGNMTVEVQSGNQQLRTPYTQKNVEHTNAAEGINRDEVPLLYQSYVQQYFEEIRKERSPAAGRTGAKPLSR